ncbi:MAG: flippase-like domain-containing protein [Euryarchaeota archaeon]|nr:flippase-like domain-containing protein [Euryarchaeota archaeon]
MRRLIFRLLITCAVLLAVSIWWGEIQALLDSMLDYLLQAKPEYVMVALLTYLLSVYLFAVRWRAVLGVLGYRVRARSLVPVLFGAMSMNNFTPASRVGGEPLRVLWLRERFGVSMRHALISIVYERLVEAVPVAVLAALTLCWLLPARGLAFAFLAMLAGCTAIVAHRLGLGRLRGAFAPTLTLSSAVWVLDVLRLKLVTLAFGLHLPLAAIGLLSLLYLVLGALPLTPGGLGVADGGVVSALTLFNVPAGAALGVVAVERLISYVLSSAIGMIALMYYGGARAWRSTELQW